MNNRLGGQRVASGELSRLQQDSSRVRNVCILAHVDHGKTTLSDGLVCSNGIISSKLAGKLRYLDSTEDEQKRGITMHSSAISLLYSMPSKQRPAPGPSPDEKKNGPGGSAGEQAEAAKDNFLINLIDSPGHIDFSSDVSTATRLCDCALVVVDVLEGVCAQTHAVFRQAKAERMRPLLVLNKVDRLASELQLSPLEAWHHLQRLVENVNALTATLAAADELAELDETGSTGDRNNEGGISEPSMGNTIEKTSHEDEGEWTFSPETGDVVFCSALDGWGFSLGDFARLWAKRLQCKPKELRKMLWGSFVLNAKTKKVTKWTTSSASPPMFVSMILDPIWQLYDAAVRDRNSVKAGRMAVKLGLDVPPRELDSSDPRTVLQSVMKRWLPLSEAVLRMVVDHGPSPATAQSDRVKVLWPQTEEDELEAFSIEEGGERAREEGDEKAAVIQAEAKRTRDEMERVRQAVESCDSSSSAPVVIFVSKMIPVKKRDITDADGRYWRPPTSPGGVDVDDQDPDSLAFVAFARVLSGTVTPSTPLLVLGPKYHPLKPGSWRHASPIGDDVWLPPSQPSLDTAADELRLATLTTDTDLTQDEQKSRQSDRLWTRRCSPGKRGGVGTGSGEPLETTANGGNDGWNGQVLEAAQVQGSCDTGSKENVALYMMMGAALHPVSRVPAGNVLALAGLEGRVNKCATLSDTPECPAMVAVTLQAKPMVRVAVEALHQQDMDKLELGLSRLYQADPAVEVSVTTRGEHVVCCLGELHLEQSLKDLRERYACVELKASLPLVPFRETVVAPGQVVGEDGSVLEPPQMTIAPWSDEEGLSLTDYKTGRIRVVTPDKRVALTLRCLPLPEVVGKLIEDHPSEVRILSEGLREARSTAAGRTGRSSSSTGVIGHSGVKNSGTAAHGLPRSVAFRQDLLRALREIAAAPSESAAGGAGAGGAGAGWREDDGEGFLRRTLAFGPRNIGANVLARRSGKVAVRIFRGGNTLEDLPDANNASRDTDATGGGHNEEAGVTIAAKVGEANEKESAEALRLVENSVVTGFQLATLAGPLAGEEMHNLCFLLEEVEITEGCLARHSSSIPSSAMPHPQPYVANPHPPDSPKANAPISGTPLDGDDQISSPLFDAKSAGGDDGCGVVGEGDSESVGRASAKSSAKGEQRTMQQQQQQKRRFGPLSGQIISIVRMGCRASMLCCPVRVVEAFYRCSLQCDQLQLGNMYGVLSRRRGRVIDEDLVEGTQLFLLTALLPVAESFGFANELLKKTSGAGTTPQLAFSHWEVIDMDPFWRPQTSEEREDEGEEGHLSVTNISRQYLDGVRKRKGLATNDKIVVAAEKQRTLTRNK